MENEANIRSKKNNNGAKLPQFNNNNRDAKGIICDYAIYADDASIEFNNYTEIPTKLRTYDYLLKAVI